MSTTSNNIAVWPDQTNTGVVQFTPTPWLNNQPTGGQMVITHSTSNIFPALLRAKSNMGAALKDSSNPFFKSKYADLNAVKAACEPALTAEKIGVFQPTIQKEGKNYVRTLLVHESGEYFGCDTEIVCSKQNDPQSLGSSITYARRYGLQSLIGLGAEDDDGNAGSGRTTAPTPAKTQNSTPTPRATFKKPTAPIETKIDSKVEGWE